MGFFDLLKIVEIAPKWINKRIPVNREKTLILLNGTIWEFFQESNHFGMFASISSDHVYVDDSQRLK